MELHCRWSAVFQLQHIPELCDWPKLISFGHCIRGLNLNTRCRANNNFNITSFPLDLNFNTCWAGPCYEDNLSGSLQSWWQANINNHFLRVYFIYHISLCYLLKTVDTPISHVCICTCMTHKWNVVTSTSWGAAGRSRLFAVSHKCKILINPKTRIPSVLQQYILFPSPLHFSPITPYLFSLSLACTHFSFWEIRENILIGFRSGTWYLSYSTDRPHIGALSSCSKGFLVNH